MWLVRAALSNFHAVVVFMMLIVVLGTVVMLGISVVMIVAGFFWMKKVVTIDV